MFLGWRKVEEGREASRVPAEEDLEQNEERFLQLGECVGPCSEFSGGILAIIT